MHDVKWIRENQQKFDYLLSQRGVSPKSQEITRLDEEKRQLINLIQQCQQIRNQKSEFLGSIIDKSSQEFIENKHEVHLINQQLAELNDNLHNNHQLQEILEILPNLAAADVPCGTDHSMNQLVRIVGEAQEIAFAKQHFELGKQLEMMDFVQTARFSGNRFVTLKSHLAKLERALISFMIDIHTTEFGFTEISPPCLVRPVAMYNVGQLPKFAEDSFATTTNYRLISTGEIPLVNLLSDTIIPRAALPVRYVAHTPCFRSEAGSSGKDTRGMMRMHQFGKVELVAITIPEESEREHQYITNSAEEILKRLDLPYRVMLLCTGDMGIAAKKTYDLEVWLPGQKQYREISSCSNCGDFQARRLKTRYKALGTNQTSFVHTLNGSALAVGRTLIAILENYQNHDGSITIPEALVPYMAGQNRITAR